MCCPVQPRGLLLKQLHLALSIFWVATLALPSSATIISDIACHPLGKFRLNEMQRPGDVVFGGLFEVHFLTVFPELSFTSEPEQPWCERLDPAGFQVAQTMAFAIEEINHNPSLLPNITLGFHLYDNCVKLAVAFRAAMALVSGTGSSFSDLGCTRPPPVLGIVGDPGSTHSIAISRVLSLFHMPLVSYFATCSCLSNRREYPSFFRTIPSDAFQVKAMVQILQRYRWTWVGLVVSNDDYGLYAARAFHKEVSHFGCVAFHEILPRDNNRAEVRRIVATVLQSTARVVVVFSTEAYLLPLTEELVAQQVKGLQWIASEAWATSPVFHTRQLLPFLGGTLGIAIRRGEIQGLREFLLHLRPDARPNNNMVSLFWEDTFGCRFKQQEEDNQSRICTGQEELEATKSAYIDVSDLRATYNVYKAVYALAHALHDLLSCEQGKGPFTGNTCAELHSLQPWQLLHYLERVNFITRYGDRVSFDENGDALAIYDVMNWQAAPDGSMQAITVGMYDEAMLSTNKLTLDSERIFWNFEPHTPPRSVCSEPCPPGARRAPRKGEPVCCFDCLPCADGEINNATDSSECSRCPPDFWSNEARDRCEPKPVEFLSFEEPLGMCLTATSLLGVCVCVVVLSVFAWHRTTPVVRANNSELSFLLLLALVLCFLCALLFIGQPQQWTCRLRHVVFGLAFALCISCILVKTIVVVMAFRATMPDGNVMKWFGAAQQRGTVVMFTAIQASVCVVWLTTAPPTPFKNTRYQNSRIIWECAVGSVAGFGCVLGYIGLLAAICFLLAFLARKLPDNFNEAKFITFSMLIFCAVWITFVPAYVSSPGKYSDAVEVFAILASSFGLLLAIFMPKCYIILLHPERNTKKAMMGRAATKK
uniref:Olfactory receptor C family, q12 n=2 Tax=Scleropages formosus TaxID=113540 RepID=A0A8C9QWY3_SCLFO